MKKINTADILLAAAALLLLAAFFGSTIANAEIGSDKIAHVAVGGALTTAVYFTMSAFTGREQEMKMPALIGAAVIGSALVLGGEIIDTEHTKGHCIDGGDLAAGLIGVGLAASLIYIFDVRTVTPHAKGVAFRF